MTTAEHVWHCGPFRFAQRRPLVMGILNITPDSFSDGGRYAETEDALCHAHTLLEQGADIIDIGGESTRPGSEELPYSLELARVLPVVRPLAREGVCVSVDSRHAEVVEACLAEGAALINDITGFTNPAMVELAALSRAGCVVMHMRGRPQTMQENPQYVDVVAEVGEYLLTQARLLADAGVERERICLDPGPGFGKNFEQNLALLQNTARLANLGTPPYLLMAAWSRKNFIGEITGEATAAKRVAGSVAAAVFAASHGAGVLRVHDVGPTVEALKVWEALYE
ncbi:MAG: dihydropteroate synthase [Coriobacteriales bacterium]|jgi:dihydropteroate synthase|nr:dihydropteroate synthase [Coriobacteriales bacterium]